MSETMTKAMRTFGVTPWQFTLAAVAVGSWWATVQPLPTQLERLNATVQQISTKVEIHGVILQSVTELNTKVDGMRRELSTIEGRLAHVPGYRAERLTSQP
jgi:outer membrane murein-binding lipoprotein Lpp